MRVAISEVGASGVDTLITEYFGGEGLERCRTPRVAGQASLVASLLKKRETIPSVFDGHLREKQPAR